MCKKCKLNDSIKNYTNPCPSKAIFKNEIDFENLIKLNDMQGNTAEKSCSKIIVVNNINLSKDNITMKTTMKGKPRIKTKTPKNN